MSRFLDRIGVALKLIEKTLKVMLSQGKSYWLIALFSFLLNGSVLVAGILWVKSIIAAAPLTTTVQTPDGFMTEIHLTGPQGKVLIFGILFFLFVFALIANINRMSTQRYTRNVLLGKEGHFLSEWVYSLRFTFTFIVWFFIQCTIGAALSILRGNNEPKTPIGLVFKGIRSFFASGLSLVWTTATFFVTPFIGFEHAGAWSAVKQSTALMKKSFGESITARFSFQSVSWMVAALSFGLCYVLPPMLWMVGIVVGVYLLTMVWVAQEVFRTILYLYVTGQETSALGQELATMSFEKKE